MLGATTTMSLVFRHCHLSLLCLPVFVPPSHLLSLCLSHLVFLSQNIFLLFFGQNGIIGILDSHTAVPLEHNRYFFSLLHLKKFSPSVNSTTSQHGMAFSASEDLRGERMEGEEENQESSRKLKKQGRPQLPVLLVSFFTFHLQQRS